MFSKRLMQDVKSTYVERKEDAERKPLVYISGKMTGVENYNKPKFDRAKAVLESKGYEVLSPADLGAEESFEWHDYMRVDVALLAMCDAIYMLDDWQDSEGALVEYELAFRLGIGLMFEDKNEDKWLAREVVHGAFEESEESTYQDKKREIIEVIGSGAELAKRVDVRKLESQILGSKHERG